MVLSLLYFFIVAKITIVYTTICIKFVKFLRKWKKNKGKEKNVPGTGLEPACLLQRQNLNLVSLPISPPGQLVFHLTAANIRSRG